MKNVYCQLKECKFSEFSYFQGHRAMFKCTLDDILIDHTGCCSKKKLSCKELEEKINSIILKEKS